MENQTVITEQVDQNDEKNNRNLPKKKRKIRCWLYCLFGFLFLFVTLILFFITGVGQRSALNFVNKVVDELTFSKVEGSLQNGLRLYDVDFHVDGVDVRTEQATIHLDARCLIHKRACIENIELKNAKVFVDTSKLSPSVPKEDKPSSDINLPLPIVLKNIQLENVEVNVDDMAISLNHFKSGIEGEGKTLKLFPTELDGLKLSLPTQQAVSSEQKIAKENVHQPVDWNSIRAQLANPLFTKLEPIKLPLNVEIPQFSAKNITVDQQVKNEDGSMAESQSVVKVHSAEIIGKSDEASVLLERLDIKTDKGNVKGQGKLNLDGDYPLSWRLVADTPAFPEFKLPASKADVQVSGSLFSKTEFLITTQGAVNATIGGDIQLSEPKTPLNLTLKSNEIRYPFIGDKGVDPLKLTNVDVALSGDLLNYQLDGKLAMSGMGIPSGDIALKGNGELTQFELEQLAINALQGQANLSGKVDWSNGVEWQSKINLDNINTKSLLPEWAAQLSGNLQTSGYAARGEKGELWAVNLSEMDLQGNLLSKKLQLKGELTADSKTLLNVPKANLIYGENNIELKGVLDDKSDFYADIKAPNLQGLVPNLKASVNGNVRIQGKITEPILDLDLVANNVSYEQTKLQFLSAKGKITTDKVVQGDVELNVKQFSQGDIKIENATLIASGSEANHSLKLTSKGDPVGANLQISGKFDRLQQKWQGQLSNVAVQSPVGEWKNDKTIQLSYDNKPIQADISAHCWNNPKLNICFPQSFKAGKEGKIPFEIKSFDLNAVQEFLDKDSQISGVISAKGDAQWFINRPPIVNVDIISNGIKFAQKLDYRTFAITLNPVKLNANFADNNLKLNTDIRIENNGHLVSDLLMKDVATTRALSGKIQLDSFTLDLVKPLLSNGEQVDGVLNGRLTVGGTALSPLLFGNLNLTGLKAKANLMPFDVIGGNLAVNFNGASSTLKGNIQTKESDLLLDGDANWQRLEAWHTRINARANRFRVDIPNIAKVDVSPNIEVKATPKELVLEGTVDVPWARIVVEELPESAVSISSDEIIMDGSAKNKQLNKLLTTKNLPQNGKGMAIRADITVNIGQDRKETVKIDAYGFNSDLKGILKVRQGSKGLGLYGQVNLVNGKFASFGQDLIVRKGVISFTGLPSQPTLDVEAIRNPEAMEDSSVVAGVKVTGVADSPDVKLFSNPSMSQDQILSYILTGRSLDNVGEGSSSNSVAAALIGMSLSKSSKTVGSVGSAFGISDLNVTTAGIGDNTKVVVSGSLTPKFKVKYGVGLFAPLTELTLRYRLAPSLYLQWISSVNQAVDLLYRFQFD